MVNMENRMQKTPTKLGLGCWPLGGDQWGSQDDRDSIATIQRAFEEGISHFDTAQMYGRGHGEELLGKALRPVRDNVFIATKILYMPKEKVEAAVAVSLKRLQTEVIDLLYIHWPKKGGDLAGMMEAMERLRAKGQIRHIGVSNFSVAQMGEVMKGGTIDVHQLCYNLLWRREERETIPYCRRHGIGIITYSSLAEGILTGKFGKVLDFAPGDHRKYTLLFEKEVWPKVYDAVESLKQIAAEAKRPLSHCAIRWLMAQEGIISVLVGCRTPDQVSHNVRSLEGDINQTVFSPMAEVSDSLAAAVPDEGNIFRWYP
jgi:myo-inositol catabolism protein IolS